METMNGSGNPMAVEDHHHQQGAMAGVGHFLRHLVGMTLAMGVGMAAGAALLVLIFSTILAPTIRGMTRVEVLDQFPLIVCLVVAFGMIVAMTALMRLSGMEWRPISEMAVAMLLPLIPIFLLLGIGVIPGAEACGIYCVVMIPAMLGAMLFRLDLYTGRSGHHAHGA